MRKKMMLALMGMVLCLGSSMTAYADYEFDAEGNAHYVEGENTCDGLLPLNCADPVYPGYMGFECYASVPIDTLSDEQILHYITTKPNGNMELDCDALAWLAASQYDDNTKFGLLNSLQDTCTESSLWIIQAPIATELKVQYFRTHSLKGNSNAVHCWWYENIGSKLTTGQTTKIDATNYEVYRRTTLRDTNTIESVRIGSEDYIIAIEDLNKALQEGKIRYYVSTCYMLGSSSEWKHYYAETTDIGCKLWNRSKQTIQY